MNVIFREAFGWDVTSRHGHKQRSILSFVFGKEFAVISLLYSNDVKSEKDEEERNESCDH